MDNLLQKIENAVGFLKYKGFQFAQAGIVLGTGLGSFIKEVEIIAQLPYHEIPHFPLSTVEFHKGQLILGKINNKLIIIMQGRFHYYEGYSMQQITFPIRVMKAIGIKYLLLSNAAGGLNLNFKKGDLVLIEDHINLLPENPLRGLNDVAFGNRFVDMSAPYNENINNHIINQAAKLSIQVKKGIYVSVMGPNLETKAEYRYLRNIGADMVGMSTVPEVIVANHIGVACAAISVITDECDPDNLKPVNIAEIIEVASKADIRLRKLFASLLVEVD